MTERQGSVDLADLQSDGAEKTIEWYYRRTGLPTNSRHLLS